MKNHQINSIEKLVNYLESSEANDFLYCIFPPESELFRNPFMWWVLQDEILKPMRDKISPIRIWLPSLVSGEELFSMIIVLHEMNLCSQIEITASFEHQYFYENIINGKMPKNLFSANESNYQRIKSKYIDLSYYFEDHQEGYLFKPEFLEKVSFFKQDFILQNNPSNIHLILYRNKSMYFNNPHQETVFDYITMAMANKGYLILGVNENANNNKKYAFLKMINEAEKIYQHI